MITRKTLTISVRGPLLTKSNTVGLFGIDARMARTPDGKLYLPGSLVLGRIAEAMRQLHMAQTSAGRTTTFGDDLNRFFAASGADGPGDGQTGRSQRRRIFVSDLIVQDDVGAEDGPRKVRTRIALDPLAGSVEHGMLQVIEAPVDPGQTVTFVGEIRLIGPQDEIDTFLPRLEKALAWIRQWGALRGLGYGEADGIATLGEIEKPEAVEAVAGSPARLRLTLQFRDLLCVGERRTAANIFESSDVVPGGVIKGALANLIKARLGLGAGDFLTDHAAEAGPYAVLAAFYDDIRFGHAFPSTPQTLWHRPSRIPLSLVEADGELVDLALTDDPAAPVLIDGNAPRFMPDWKDDTWSEATALVGWPDVPAEFRIRTAIDQQTRAAEASRLFAISCRRTDRHHWCGFIDLSAVAEDAREQVIGELQLALSDGLAGVGRGGAFATVTLAAGTDTLQTITHEERTIVVLQTPALLRCPEPGQTGDVTAAYAAAFRELSPSGPTLKAAFVRERLAGAEFMARRLPSGQAYRPFLLTEPGSVFVFEGAGESVPFGTWLHDGLPVPERTRAFYGFRTESQLWKYCPYTPDNGYGEIATATHDAADRTDIHTRHRVASDRVRPVHELAGNGCSP